MIILVLYFILLYFCNKQLKYHFYFYIIKYYILFNFVEYFW